MTKRNSETKEEFQARRTVYQKLWWENHPDKRKGYNRTYYVKHRPAILISSRRYEREHRERLNEVTRINYHKDVQLSRSKTKAKRDKNRESFNARRREYASRNREDLREYYRILRFSRQDEYNEKQRVRNKRPEYLAYRRKLRKHKHDTDPNFRIMQSLRTRVQSVLKGLSKSQRTIELLGCDVVFLRMHLEAQFQQGMNWGNYGQWHIDHIVPCASFDLQDKAQQNTCFNYTNLQPLWAKDNLQKGANIIPFQKVA